MKPAIFHKILLVGLIVTCIIPTNAQILRTKNWHFGYNTSLRFETDTVIVDTSAMISGESCASISDEQGKLLLYTDGVTVWNKKHQIIGNGTSLLGHESSSSGSVLLPFKNKDSIFYLFTTDYQGNSNGLRYSKILNLGNDSFNIISKNNLLYSSVAEPIGAINHQDNIRQWIMARQFNGYDYYAFLLGKDGVIDCPVISKSTLYIGKSTNPVSAQNDCAFSPNGDKFVSSYIWLNKIELFMFSTLHGELFNQQIVDNIRVPTGVIIETNGKFSYVLERDWDIVQIDLEPLIQGTNKVKVYNLKNTFELKIGVQHLINNKILINQIGSNYWGLIQNPNKSKDSCNYQANGILLRNARPVAGLPNFNFSYFNTPALDFSYIQDCKTNVFNFAAKDSFAATDFQWHFTNKNRSYTALGKEISQNLLDTGIWLVQLVAGNKQRRDTLTKSIEVFPLVEKNFLGNDTGYCSGQKVNLILRTPWNMHCIHWMGKSGQDYENYHVDSLLVDSAGLYYVKITNKSFCTFYDTLSVIAIPKPNKPIISYLSNELASTEIAHRYRWFFNDTFLIETTNRSIIPKQNGFYRLQFINDLGCESEKSDSFWVQNIGIAKLPNQSLFILYPNPSNGQIFIQVWNPNNYAIEITENTGKVVYKTNIQITDKASINTSLPSGNYYLKLTDKIGTSATSGFQIIN